MKNDKTASDGKLSSDIYHMSECPIKMPRATSMTQASIDWYSREQSIIDWYEEYLLTQPKKCNMCDNQTTIYCLHCNEPVCENCTVGYTQHNQIDYTLCISCYKTESDNRAEYYSNNQ